EGGIRVPCFVRWPAGLPANRAVDRIAAHIDLAPTLLAACGVAPPPVIQLDGVNLLPLLRGDEASAPDRLLFFQWHRGAAPETPRAFPVRSPGYKLVQAEGADGVKPIAEAPLELFDMTVDP